MIVQNTSKTYHHSLFHAEAIFKWFLLAETDCSGKFLRYFARLLRRRRVKVGRTTVGDSPHT